MNTSLKTTQPLVFTLAILAGAASNVLAQNSPLGDGTGLQKNSPGLQHSSPGLQRDLRVPGTGTPAAGTYRDIAAEVRFRNAIITGNAPGGIAFRGSVGYTDPMDFRGRLASDDLFTFRRDSLASGAAGVGIRGIDSLQYQFAMTSGNVNSKYAVVNRDDGAIARPVDQSRPEPGIVTGSLRSTATFAAERTLRPAVIGMRQPTAGNYERLFASGLTGLHYQPWEAASSAAKDAANSASKPAFSGATPSVDLTIDRGISPFDQSRDRLKKALEKANEKAGDKPVDKPADKPADSTLPTEPVAVDPLSAIDERLAEIRNVLAPRKSAMDLVKKVPAAEVKTAIPAAVPKLDRNTLAAIKDAGAKTDTLIPVLKVPAPTDLYNKFMSEGETLLKANRFFDAEERYALALNSRIGDLSAMVGRLHSQIGAGMKVSASMNLRRLITEHPEVLGMTYDLSLMGGKGRVDILREKLRTQLADAPSRDTALVLGYLGRQSGDEGKADLAAGLAYLEANLASFPVDSSDAQAETKLVELLNGIWNAR